MRPGNGYSKLFVSIALYLLCYSTAIAQRLPFVNYRTSEGLIHNRTSAVRQDSNGYIWIATDLGIDRYDGRNFKHFPCPDNAYLSSRYGIRFGNLAVFTIDWYGLAICNGDSVRFVKTEVGGHRSIDGVVGVNDTTFYVTDALQGLFLVCGTKTRQVKLPITLPEGMGFVDLYKDRKGNIWILTSKGMIFLPGAKAESAFIVPFFGTKYMNVVRQDNNGDVYVALREGLVKYTEAQCDDLLHEKPEMIVQPPPEITSIAFDADNNIWMTNTYYGLYKYNKLSHNLQTYGIVNGLVSQNTWDAYFDKENNLWIASENGVNKLTTSYYASIDFSTSAYQGIKSAEVWNDSTLLFSNLVDIYSLNGYSVKKIDGYKCIPSYLADVMLKMPDGRLLVNVSIPLDAGTFDVNTYLYDINKNSLVNGQNITGPHSVPWMYITQGHAVEPGELWINSSAGLQLYFGGRFHKAPSPMINNKPVWITYVEGSPNGDLWLMDNYKQLIRYSKERSSADSFPYTFKQQQIVDSKQFGNRYLYKLLADSHGNLWTQTRGYGIFLSRTDKDGNVTKTELLDMSTFSSGIINCMTEDADHNIWVGTAGGLDKITFHGDSFSVEKNLYGGELCGKYIFFVKIMGKKLYAGTSGCIGIVDLDKHHTPTPPGILLSGVKVHEREINHAADQQFSFDPHDNAITFSFTGISFRDEHNIRYSYMLEGLETEWSKPVNAWSITYSRIPPGTYTFKVRALSVDGLWSQQPATFCFTIRRPFYTEWWFISLCVVAVGAAVYGILRYRVNKILEIHRIRQTISKDLHDDIGATVSSISILANMAKSDLVTEAKRNHFLETIQEESKHVSESLSDIVWSVNPKNDSLEIMFARMQRYASELFEAKNIAYHFDITGKIDDLRMDMTKRQHVYLVFKEAVNNLAKYSGANNAAVTLTVTEGQFTLVIADDGIGFDADAAHGGNGIINMKKRVEDIKGKLAIQSKKDKGTTITLTVSV